MHPLSVSGPSFHAIADFNKSLNTLLQIDFDVNILNQTDLLFTVFAVKMSTTRLRDDPDVHLWFS